MNSKKHTTKSTEIFVFLGQMLDLYTDHYDSYAGLKSPNTKFPSALQKIRNTFPDTHHKLQNSTN